MSGATLYSLFYKNEKSGQIENANGSTDLSGSNFNRSIDAATCSSNGVCVPHIVNQGIIKVKVDSTNWFDSQWFKIEGGSLVVKHEYSTGSVLDLSSDEERWLNTGKDVVITPTVEPTLESTPKPTESQEGQLLDGISSVVTPTATIMPQTVTPTVDVAVVPTTGIAQTDEAVQAQVIQLDGSWADPTLVPATWTNQADYSPTEKVVVSGKNFTPNNIYTIAISSTDNPASTHSDTFIALSDGTFIYEYQLDGTYRPNYSIVISDSQSRIVATTTFTDSRTVNSATVDGASSVTVLGGATVSAAVTVNHAGSDNNWQSTGWRIGTSGAFNCVNHSDHNSDGTQTETFNITAPTSAGTYTVQFQAYNNDTCSSGGSSIFGLTNSLIVVSKSITIIKDAEPKDAQDFAFATTGSGLSGFSLDDDVDPTLSNTKLFSGLANGTYSITEGTTSNWSLSNIVCAGSAPATKDLVNRKVTIVISNSNTNATCTFTNTATLPKLTVVTVVNNGTTGATTQASAFQMKVDGTNIAQGVSNTQTAGSHTISESGPSGYSASYSSSCPGGAVSLSYGEDKICTVTNTAIAPKLTVTKIVNNNNGGTMHVSDFPLRIDSTIVISGVQNIVSAGLHTISEISNSGYSGTISGDCASNGTLTILPGDVKACTITNDDIQPKLTVTKIVSGGSAVVSDFTLKVSGTTVTSGVKTGFNVGTYSVTETPNSNGAGYTGVIVCNGQVTNSITLALGNDKACVITNTRDIGTVTVIKNIVPSNDPGRFNLKINNSVSKSNAANGDSTGAITTNTGTVTVSETNGTNSDLSDYTSSISCNNFHSGDGTSLSFTLNKGNSVICTITNTRNQGTIELKKVWSGTPGQTTLKIGTSENGSQIASQQTGINGAGPLSTDQKTVNTGTYYLSETGGLSNYDANLSCFNDENNNGDKNRGEDIVHIGNHNSVRVDTDQHIVCTFTNTRDTGTLNVHKNIDTNGDSSFEVTSDATANNTYGFRWGLSPTPGADSTHFGDSQTVDTGAVSVYENNVSGYHFSGWYTNLECHDHDRCEPEKSCSKPDGTTLPVSLSITKDHTTTITLCNTRNTGTIKIIKKTIGADGTFNFISTGFSNFSLTTNSNTATQTINGLVTDGKYGVQETVPSGWALTSATCDNGTPSDITIATGATTTCTFTNTKLGSISVMKDMVGGIDAFYFSGDVAGTVSTQGGELTTVNVLPGTYIATESAKIGWDTTSIQCTDENSTGDISTGTAVFKVEANENVVCTFTNTKRGSITVVKNTTIMDDSFDFISTASAEQSGLPTNFSVKTDKNTGTVTFDNILPGTFSLSESDKHGWSLKGTECTEGQISAFTVTPGKNVTCTFNNEYITPELSLAKLNDIWPNNTSPGSDVHFTLKLKVTKNNMSDLQVIDLLANGIKYKPGSWSATKNGVSLIISEPQYHSPGKWDVGSVAENDEIVLSYTATVDPNQNPGLYKDLAWAYGCETNDCTIKVLASSVSSGTADTGIVNDQFVGTKVAVNKDTQNSTTVSVTKSQTSSSGEVLGASTSNLPGTGASTIWTYIMTLVSGFGIISNIMGLYLKKKGLKRSGLFVVGLLVAVSLFTSIHTVYAADSSLTIRISEPKTPINQTFGLVFVALDIQDRAMTVKCYKKGPSDASYSQFGSDIALINGGNTGTCDVTNSLLSQNSTYNFKADVFAGADTAESPIVAVDYNTSGPGTPSNYSKDHISSCQNKISFRTSDDGGKTVKVEIYRNENTSFGVDPSNRVGTVGIGSNTDGSFTDTVPDCNKTYYYVIRAFDIYGNGSGVIGDSVVTVATSSTTSTGVNSTGITAGAIPVNGQQTIPGEESVLGAQTLTPGASESAGSILGVTVIPVNPGSKNTVLGALTAKNMRPWYIVIIVLAIGFLSYAIYQRRNKEDSTS